MSVLLLARHGETDWTREKRSGLSGLSADALLVPAAAGTERPL